MADSIINICNRALSQVAETSVIASISPPDGTTEATQCALWYDTMRQRLLRAAPWGFSRTQLTLTQVGDLVPDNTSPYPFLWAYAYPSDCLKFRYILPQPLPPLFGAVAPPLTGTAFVGPSQRGLSRNNRFLIHNLGGTRVILSNVPNAIGVYTKDEENVDMFDQLFTGALEDALSFKLCIPLSGNISMQDKFRAAAEASLLVARAIDGNEAIPSSDPKVDWIEARGKGYVFGSDSAWLAASWGNWYTGWEEMNWGM